MKMSELLNEISMYLKAEDILNSENMIPIENVKELVDELQQKENIIKEVREYIEEKEKDDDNWVDYELLIEPIRIKEILDKENKQWK